MCEHEVVKNDYNHLKAWMLPMLQDRGLSIEKFSDLVGVSKTVVYNWMHDLNRPTEETMVVVCRELGRPLEEGLRQYTPKPLGRPPGKTKRTGR